MSFNKPVILELSFHAGKNDDSLIEEKTKQVKTGKYNTDKDNKSKDPRSKIVMEKDIKRSPSPSGSKSKKEKVRDTQRGESKRK